MLALLALSPSGLLVQQPPRLPRVVAERLTTAAAAAAAFGTCEAAQAFALPAWDDVMVELNKPPITLNPFSLQPAGAAFFAGYGAYLVWNVFRPPNAAEVEAQDKRDAESVVAAEAAAPFLKAAAGSPGARTTESGLVYEELAAGEGASPGLEPLRLAKPIPEFLDGSKRMFFGNKLYLLLAFVPLAFVAEHLEFSDAAIFGMACLAILPLAGLLGEATEQAET